MMTKHVTFTIDDDLDRKIREYQATVMLERNRAYSFAAAVNDLLARGT